MTMKDLTWNPRRNYWPDLTEAPEFILSKFLCFHEILNLNKSHFVIHGQPHSTFVPTDREVCREGERGIGVGGGHALKVNLRKNWEKKKKEILKITKSRKLTIYKWTTDEFLRGYPHLFFLKKFQHSGRMLQKIVTHKPHIVID